MAVGEVSSTVHLVDLATGVCTPGRPDMLRSRYLLAAAGLPGGRIVCAGGWGGAGGHLSSAEMGGRRCRERWMQHGHGDNCPR